MSQCDVANAANQSAEKSILFSGPMVRAILAGAKTETRRTLKPQPGRKICECHFSRPGWAFATDGGVGCTCEEASAVRWAPDDRLWVRETFSGPWSAREAAQSPKSWSIDTP